MAAQPLWLRDLAAFSLQAASIVIAGSLLLPLLRLHLLKIRLAYWQTLLAACVLLPLIQPWRPEWAAVERLGALSRVRMAGESSLLATWSVPSLVFVVLAGGILLRLVWTMLGLWKLGFYRMRAHRLHQGTASILEARALTGVRSDVYLSAEILSPATFGLLSPGVLLPRRFIQLPAAQQKAIACHEFLHVARHDWAWTISEEVVLAFLWFHPAVWWVAKNIRLSREQAVDGEVIRVTSSRGEYLGALLAMARQKVESIPTPLFLTESQLVERVSLIAKEIKMSRSRLIASLLFAAAVLLVTGVAAVWSFPLKAPASAPSLISSGLPQVPNSSPAKVGEGVKAPTPIRDPAPAYTRSARKAHLTGTASFSAVVNTKGDVDGIREISKPLGLGLDQSAIRTIRTWKFKPGLRKGKPVAVRVKIEVAFRVY